MPAGTPVTVGVAVGKWVQPVLLERGPTSVACTGVHATLRTAPDMALARWPSLAERPRFAVLARPRVRKSSHDRGARMVRTATNSDKDKMDAGETLREKGLGFFAGLFGALVSLVGFVSGKGDKKSKPTPSSASSEASSRIVQQFGLSPVEEQTGESIYALGPYPKCTEASDLRRPDRHFTVVTTAALPWKTGPAINALLRALTLAKSGKSVVLLLPWIEMSDQVELFPEGEVFEDQLGQERFIRSWCMERAQIDSSRLALEVRWYDASYVQAVRSIFPKGDCSQALGDGSRDVLILEEPEHLCWYHNGLRWTELFNHVVGVVHTNYQVYVQNMGYEGIMGTPAFRDSLFVTFTSLVCSAYCDVTIKLSSAGITLPNEVNCNVHGVRKEFLDIGRRGGVARSGPFALSRGTDNASAKAYFIGKAVMQKGWDVLLNLLEELPSVEPILVDGYGSGPDGETITARAEELEKKSNNVLRFYPGTDHADKRFWGYKVLVNPSTAEMLCTVTAEALAMGKRVVLPRHPSNEFFAQHFADRCYFFQDQDVDSFGTALQQALEADGPRPLDKTMEELLAWDTAINRLCGAAEVRVLSGNSIRPSEVRSARLAYKLHNGIQTENPAISDLLKGATQKEPTPWQKYISQWREGASSKQVLNMIETRMKQLQNDAKVWSSEWGGRRD